MKVFEILQSNVNEETLTARMKGFDWKYEFADDVRRQQRGHQAMQQLEAMMYSFWKSNPKRACELWEQYSPYGKKGITPSFILRLDQEDK